MSSFVPSEIKLAARWFLFLQVKNPRPIAPEGIKLGAEPSRPAAVRKEISAAISVSLPKPE
jgi:hypothetical protein